jgi:hypothetical protein
MKLDDLNLYPDAKEFCELFPREFIEIKVNRCPDTSTYVDSYSLLQGFLCVYSEIDMRILRNHMIYRIHDRLMTEDFGVLHNSLSSKCSGLTKEAEIFVETLNIK